MCNNNLIKMMESPKLFFEKKGHLLTNTPGKSNLRWQWQKTTMNDVGCWDDKSLLETRLNPNPKRVH